MQRYLTFKQIDDKMKNNAFVADVWKKMTSEQKDNWLVTACNFIDSLNYVGIPVSQEAAFPRIFPDDCSEYLKQFNKKTPLQIGNAIVEYISHYLAYQSAQLKDISQFKSAGVSNVKAGSVEIEFSEIGIKEAPDSVYRILSLFLDNNKWGRVERS